MTQSEFAALMTAVMELKGDLQAHTSVEEQEQQRVRKALEELQSEVKSMTAMVEAFPHLPDGSAPDYHGHRNYHERRITDLKDSHAMWAGVKRVAIEKLVTGVLIGAGVIFALGLQHWIGAMQ